MSGQEHGLGRPPEGLQRQQAEAGPTLGKPVMVEV